MTRQSFIFVVFSLSLAAQSGAASGTGAEYRVTATLLTRNPHAVVEDPTGVQTRVHAGAVLGACYVSSIQKESILLDCPEGVQRLRLVGARYKVLRPQFEGSAEIPRAVFNEYFADRQSFFNALTLTPDVRESELYGYRVDHLDPSSSVGALPIEIGDVITALNGVPARDGRAFIGSIKDLPDAGSISIALQRDGQTHTLNLRIID